MSPVGRRTCVYLGLAILIAIGSTARAAPVEKTLNSDAKVIAGQWAYESTTISIAGQPFDGYGTTRNIPPFATFDIRGWDGFQANIGVRDDASNEKCRVLIEVDGKQVWRKELRQGENPEFVSVPLTGHKTLTIRHDCDDTWHLMTVGEPKLTKGKPSRPPRARPEPPGSSDGGQQADSSPAAFVVDPRDLDRLAEELWKAASTNPDMQQRVRNGQVAVPTFELINVPSPSVARDVAEDLSTAMIKAGFRLVERGQLDKVLKDLKIQNMGLVDPKTAQKIGQLSGCDVILLGSISDRGQFVVINARLMETASGKSLVADRVEMRKMPIGS